MSAPGRTPQLRRYQLTAGTVEELVRWWRDDLVPVRRSFGFGIRFGRVILATDAMRRKPKPTDGSRPTCWRRGGRRAAVPRRGGARTFARKGSAGKFAGSPGKSRRRPALDQVTT